jgi:hypothetical protein
MEHWTTPEYSGNKTRRARAVPEGSLQRTSMIESTNEWS